MKSTTLPWRGFWALVLVFGVILSSYFHNSLQIVNDEVVDQAVVRVESHLNRDYYTTIRCQFVNDHRVFRAVVPRFVKVQEGDMLLVSGVLTSPREMDVTHGFLKLNKPPQKLSETRRSQFLRWRQTLGQRFREDVGGEAGRLSAALFLGDRSDYFGPLQKNFQTTGTLHYLALSGLHLGLLFLPFIYLFRLFGMSPRWQLMACVPLMLAYLGLVGVIPSLVRAFISFVAVAIAVSSERHIDKFNVLCLVATLCLVWDPSQVESVGFYMTFAALGGILFLGPRIEALWLDNKTKLWSLVSYNTGAWMGIAPVLLFFFGEVSLSALVLNIILIPVFAILLMACLIYVVLPFFTVGLIVWIWHVVDVLLSWASHYMLGPWGPMSPKLLAAVWLALVLFVCVKESLRIRYRVLSLTLIFVVAFVLPATNSFKAPRVTQLNVGQGSCYLMEITQGQAVMVDCGGSSLSVGQRTIVPKLRDNGVKNIPVIFLTHLDSDHTIGLEDVLARFPVQMVITHPEKNRPEDIRAFAKLKKLLAQYGVEHQEMSRGDTRQVLGLDFRCLHPGPDSPGEENERSLVLHVEGEKKSILFTGDLDEVGARDLLKSVTLPQATIMTAPHHGSRLRYVPVILDEVRPQELWLSARPNFPQEKSILAFPQLKKSWEGHVESNF